MDFAEARYYNPSHGRFTAVDPLLASGKSDNPQSFNRYVYVMNSPTKLIDPTGLLPASSSACRQCGKADWLKGLETFESRLKETLRTGINFLTKRDMALLQFHVSNGTALGHYYLNNAQQTTGPARSPRRQNTRGQRLSRGNRASNRRPSNRAERQPIGPGLNEANAQKALENDLTSVLLIPLGPQRYYPRYANQYSNHHIFPQAKGFAEFWRNAGININQFTVRIPRGGHIELHSGIGQGSGGRWNNAWRNFFARYPDATREQIFQQGNLMIYQLQVIGPQVHYRYRPPSIGPR